MISEQAPLGNNDVFIIRNALALVSINPNPQHELLPTSMGPVDSQ
jgi:hypothetical protein